MTKRCMVALITPFHADGSIDYMSMARLIRRLLKEGCDGFIVCGTTAETPTLRKEERRQILRFVISQVKGKAAIYYGCGSNDTLATIAACKEVEKEAIDGVLLVTPYYNKPSQEGLYRHFSAISQATTLPIMLYQVPARCGVAMEAETIIRLAHDHETIKALKFASSDFALIRKVKENCDLTIYSGEDEMLLEGLEEGMQGIISVSAHLILPQIKKLMEQYEQSCIDPLLHLQIKAYARHLFMESSPAPLKYLLSKREECENVLRLPLVGVSAQTQKTLDAFFASTTFFFD